MPNMLKFTFDLSSLSNVLKNNIFQTIKSGEINVNTIQQSLNGVSNIQIQPIPLAEKTIERFINLHDDNTKIVLFIVIFLLISYMLYKNYKQ